MSVFIRCESAHKLQSANAILILENMAKARRLEKDK